jgi:DNA primase
MVDEVRTLLDNFDIKYIPSGRDYLIHCLNPEHPDRNPSLRIDKLKGIGQCLSCGYKVNLFKHFNVFTDGKSAQIASLKEKIAKCMSDSVGLKIPGKAIPWREDYRNIKASTFREFDAFTYHEDFGNRLVFPMYAASGKIVAFNGRALGNESPRYDIYPSHVELPMFPGRPKPVNSTLVLVEGIFDFLNLHDKGLTNAVALMGVTTLHNKKGLNKNKINLFKMSGTTRIFLCLDADDAGRKATEELKPLLEAEGFYVGVIELEDDSDPGELSKSEVEWVIDYINGRQS